jgi:hypothetical protein
MSILKDLSRKLGIRIGYYRKLHFMSQEELAERVSCSIRSTAMQQIAISPDVICDI